MSDDGSAPHHDVFDLFLGQSVAMQMLIHHSPRLAVFATSFIAYPTGFTFQLHLVQRYPPQTRASSPRRRGGFQMGFSGIQLNVDASGGQTLNTEPDEIASGGPGWMSARYLVQPLPPPGRASIVLDWPGRRLAGVRANWDSGPLLEAAARAKPLW